MNRLLDHVRRSIPAVRVGISMWVASSSVNGCLYFGAKVRPAMCTWSELSVERVKLFVSRS